MPASEFNLSNELLQFYYGKKIMSLVGKLVNG